MTDPKNDPPVDLSKLSLPEKKALLEQLVAARKDSRRAPLSLGQERIWIQEQLFPLNAAHILMVALRIRGELPLAILESVFDQVVKRHEILRTSFAFDGESPLQQVHPPATPRPVTADLSDLPGDEQHARMNEIFRHQLRQPFDLATAPLFRLHLIRLGPRDQVLALAIHHLICDGWSLEVLIQDVVRFARAALIGIPPRLPPLPIQYAEFARRQRARLDTGFLEPQLAFWLPRLGDQALLEVPTDYPRPAYRTFGGELVKLRTSNQLRQRLDAFCRTHRVTPFMTLLAAFQVLLAWATGEHDISVRSPFSTRDQPELEGLIGFFVNTLILRSKVDPGETFAELVRNVRAAVLDGFNHRDLPFESLLQATRERWQDASRAPGAQIGFALHRQHQTSFSIAGRTLEIISLHSGSSQLDLTLSVWFGSEISFELEFNSALYRRTSMETLVRQYRKLLGNLLEDPACPIGEIPWMSPAQARVFSQKWLSGQRNRPGAAPAVERMFESRVRRQKMAVALVWQDSQVSFQELNRNANRWAGRFRERGIGPGVLTAVALPRSPQLVTALLAIFKAGGAYLPLDPDYPRDRLLFMLEDSRPAFLLADGGLTELLQTAAPTAEILNADDLEAGAVEQSGRNLGLQVDGSQLAYVIYTSGSSGRPKGVEVPRRALSNQMSWIGREFELGPGDRILQRTPLGFDASIWELFAPLTCGATLVLAPPGASLEIGMLLDTVRSQHVTHLQLVPSLLRILLEENALADCPSLKMVFSGGELLTAELQRLFHQQSKARLVNLYGPTEACINASFHRCLPEESQFDAPLGRPIDNIRFQILSEGLKPLPEGLAGELCISGEGLALGYRHRPEETSKAFVDDPSGKPAAKLYRTGDRVRLTADGRLQYLGRLDCQLKVSGARIEPAEIETVLNGHPSVRRSLVIARTEPRGESRLVAYLVPSVPGVQPDLRIYLEQRLPRFMLPSQFVWIERVPLTPAGKVDYRQLPAPRPRPAHSAPFELPRNQTEELLHSIWRDLLQVEELSIHDDFFELGGASLQVIRLAARADREGCRIAPAQVFQHPTIARLAEAVSQQEVAPLPATSFLEDDLELPAELLPQWEKEAGRQRQTRAGSVIESLGVYLPPREVTTEEIIQGCRRPVKLPLRHLTGIESRRMAGDKEFSFDLARKAVEECLRNSRHQPAEIDLILCCNISRFDSPRTLHYEPSTAIRLKAALGFERALTFDLTNACAGLFTGIYLADRFLACGLFERCLVVSGEYITHLTETAQKEITEFLDPRLACLTLGDAGAALILERSPDGEAGFHAIHLLTLAKYSPLCIAKATDQEHGGAIMLTDMVQVSATATRHSMVHAALMLQQTGWALEDFEHLIAHQTSRNALRGASREINRLLGREATGEQNLIDNLSQRGNTASTSHLVALWDGIRNGTILDGNRALFSITGSGQTVGTALYRFDDLPTRIRTRSAPRREAVPDRPDQGRIIRLKSGERIRIDSCGTLSEDQDFRRDALELACRAAEDCLNRCPYDRQEVGALIHCGVYRNDFLAEPALAAFLADRLRINHEILDPGKSPTTLAFDLCNGPLGILNGCLVASGLIRSRACDRVLLTASEIENNAFVAGQPLLGIEETGSALLLGASSGETGFGAFLFRDFPDYLGLHRCQATYRGGISFLEFATDPGYREACLVCVEETVRQLLEATGLREDSPRVLILPGLSEAFDGELSRRLGIPRIQPHRRLAPDTHLATSALALGLREAFDSPRIASGDLGLLIAVSPGIQVGSALYYF